MKKGRIALVVALVALFLVVLQNRLNFWGYLPDNVPVTRCIGLKPVLDKKRERFNRDTVRNLVYQNESSDPLFYSNIVQKVEACDWIKSKDFIRREDIDGDRFALAGSPYRDGAWREKTAFISKNWSFQCVIYDGTDFVLVVLTARY
jgi:hypothetical protein